MTDAFIPQSATSDQSVLKARALVKQQQHSIRQNEYSTSDEHSPDYQPMFYPTGIFVSCAVEEEKKRELVRLQHNIREKESNRQASWEAVRLEEKDLKKKTTEKEADIRRHAWE